MLNWEKTALKSIDFYQHSSCVLWLSKEEKHVIKVILVYFGRLAPLTMRRDQDLLSQISSNISLSKQQKSWIIMEKSSVKATKINHPDLWKKSTVWGRQYLTWWESMDLAILFHVFGTFTTVFVGRPRIGTNKISGIESQSKPPRIRAPQTYRLWVYSTMFMFPCKTKRCGFCRLRL